MSALENWEELLADARENARREAEAHWAAGRSTYGGGVGAEAHKLFEVTPDGTVYEVQREGEEYVRVRKVKERGTTIARTVGGLAI